MKKYTIYILYNPRITDFFYIGHTYNPVKRLNEHKRVSGKKIIMDEIQTIYGNKRQALKVEKHWIQYLSKYFRLNNLCSTSNSKSYKRNKV